MKDDAAAATPLLKRFPALSRLAMRGGAHRVPFVQQMEASDCGAACLAMVMGFHGRQIALEEARGLTGSGRDGVTLLSIQRGAERNGLRGRGVRFEPEDLPLVPAGTILHWGFNHFVVFEAVDRRGVAIVDPAVGRRLLPMPRFREHFTGVGLTLEPGEGFERKEAAATSLRALLHALRPHRSTLIRIVVLSLMVQVFALALPVLTGLLVDEIVPHDDRQLLRVIGVGLAGVVVFQFFVSLIRSHMLLFLKTLLSTRLSLGFMEHLVRLPYAFFMQRSAGDLIVRYQSNQRVRDVLTSSALSTIFDGMLASLYLIALLVGSPAMAALTLVLALLHAAVFLVSRRRYAQLAAQDLEVRSRSQAQLVEMIAGMETLKTLGAEGRAVERWSHRFVDELNVGLAQGRLYAWTGALRSALTVASPLVILLFGGHLVMQGEIRLGAMLALNALAIGFLIPSSSLVSAGLDLQELRSHLERIEDVLKTAPEQDEESVTAREDVRGEIQLDRVAFSYQTDQTPIVRDISERFDVGRKIAIVGKSGAGKSTLARLVVGLYRPTSGRVLYDGADLKHLDVHAVRERVGVVTQGTRLFATSIRNNVSLADPTAGIDRVIEACKLAEIHDEILAMPMAYETLLADAGASLSGGQRQRIALARALLRRPAVLLLDEATSELDTVTESRIMVNLDALRCTRIVIAHRLSTVANADRILVLDEGRVSESGTHAELLRAGGAYAELVAAQAGLS